MQEILKEEILKLKKDLNAVILSHYYQEDEIQEIADFRGDSLELSKYAAKTDADVIVFCGVKFMAEVAKILNPSKTVLIPDMKAGCSLEESCPPESFKKFISKYEGYKVVTYINSSPEVKALSDVIVTSSNAKRIIEGMGDKIIFAPDKNLGAYLSKITGKEMVLWPGACIVHENFAEKNVIALKTKYNNAKTIAHPECEEHILKYADFIGSTSALIKYVQDFSDTDFIILTEPGVIYSMKKQSPSNRYHAVEGVEKKGV
jgi:quinolinate synthase